MDIKKNNNNCDLNVIRITFMTSRSVWNRNVMQSNVKKYKVGKPAVTARPKFI